MIKDDPETTAFEWNAKREHVALLLADGYTQKDAGVEAKVSDRTIRTWLQHPDFAAEVDRLTFMVGIARRAERLRIAARIIRSKAGKSEKDLLEWLKYAQGETDGVRLDLTALAEAAGTLADS